MGYLLFNGKFIKNGSNIIAADNRGLRYGDGLFETICYQNGQLILLDEHLARLWSGMKLLRFEIPKLFQPDLLEENILKLIQKNELSAARVRLSVIRGDGGLYDTQSHQPQYIIQAWQLPPQSGSFNENGLQLCVYRQALKSVDTFSNCKNNNFLPYFMGAIFAKEQRCNDAVILNQHGRICDSTIANIFIIKDNKVYTPSLNEGCVAGIMRHLIITELKKQGQTIIEKAITEEEMLLADEVFLSNSILKLRWVGGIGDKKYGQELSRKIYTSLRETNPTVFC